MQIQPGLAHCYFHVCGIVCNEGSELPFINSRFQHQWQQYFGQRVIGRTKLTISYWQLMMWAVIVMLLCADMGAVLLSVVMVTLKLYLHILIRVSGHRSVAIYLS